MGTNVSHDGPVITDGTSLGATALLQPLTPPKLRDDWGRGRPSRRVVCSEEQRDREPDLCRFDGADESGTLSTLGLRLGGTDAEVLHLAFFFGRRVGDPDRSAFRAGSCVQELPYSSLCGSRHLSGGLRDCDLSATHPLWAVV